MSYHTPQYFVKNYSMCLFLAADQTIIRDEYQSPPTTTMDLTTMRPVQIWPLSDLPTDSSRDAVSEGDVFECSDVFCVYNPNQLEVPLAMSSITEISQFNLDPWTYVGNIDLHLFNVPRHIRDPLELYRFLPNYDAWFRNLGIHNQSAIEQGTATKVNHIIHRLLLSPEEVQDSFWFKREFARHFAPATFKAQRTFPSFCTEVFFNRDEEAPLTFPHYSAQEPGQVAFQPFGSSYRDGDRQVRTKPGRYLNKHLDLDSDQVRKCVAIENGDKDVHLKFAKTVEEFTDVYLRGPSSCMSHHIGWYDRSASTGRLPISVLANGDIEIAYLELDNGIIPARALVVQSTQKYIEIYHNSDAMDGARGELESRLNDADFRRDGEALVGQKIERLMTDEDKFVCPYIDSGGLPVDDDGEHLIIRDSGCGEMSPNYSTGVCERLEHCNHCEEARDTELQYVEGHGDVCESCIDDDFVWAYQYGGNEGYIHRDGDAIVVNGEWYEDSERCLNYYDIFWCSESDEWFDKDDLVLCSETEDFVHPTHAVYIDNREDYVKQDLAVYSTTLEQYLVESDATYITMEDGDPDWIPDDEIVYSEYHQQSIHLASATEIGNDFYWTVNLVCDEVGNYSLLDTGAPLTLETAA